MKKEKYHLGVKFLKLLGSCMRTIKQESEPEVSVQVEVNIIKTAWLFKKNSDNNRSNSDYLQLIDTLEKVKNEALYTTTFVEALLETVYRLRVEVFNYIFIPFLI